MGLALGTRCDQGAGDARLVLPLVGHQRTVVHVTDRVEPSVGDVGHAEGVVHVQPTAGVQADGLQSDVLCVRRAAGREQDLVGYQ